MYTPKVSVGTLSCDPIPLRTIHCYLHCRRYQHGNENNVFKQKSLFGCTDNCEVLNVNNAYFRKSARSQFTALLCINKQNARFSMIILVIFEKFPNNVPIFFCDHNLVFFGSRCLWLSIFNFKKFFF
jgi:hypothetical protein